MTASPQLHPFLPPSKASSIASWITQLPLELHLEPMHVPMATQRRDRSPEKRRRLDGDGVTDPSVTDLGRLTTLSPASSRQGTSSPRRGNSPSRKVIAALETASPPIRLVTRSEVQLPENKAARDKVMDAMERLGPNQLKGWVPPCLKDQIQSDKEFGLLFFQPNVFLDSPHSLSDCDASLREELQCTLGKVKRIFKRAIRCNKRGADENNWCLHVIQPLMDLALELSGKGKMLLESVQTQAIDPRYLSIDPQSGKRLDRRADFAYAYLDEDADIAALMARLLPRVPVISHLLDADSERTVLFSGLEAKPSNGDRSEAEYQLSIFMAASLRKKAELARMAGLLDPTSVLIEPAFVVVGHEWYFYLALLQSDDGVQVLRHGNCSTEDVLGVFQVLRMLRVVIEYGLEGIEQGGVEAKAGYWGGFLGPVLEKLASGTQIAIRGNARVATPGDEATHT